MRLIEISGYLKPGHRSRTRIAKGSSAIRVDPFGRIVAYGEIGVYRRSRKLHARDATPIALAKSLATKKRGMTACKPLTGGGSFLADISPGMS
jgi:hypothetical protein